MHVVATLALVVAATVPLLILWHCRWHRTVAGIVGVALTIGIATGIGFVAVEDSPICDDVCEKLVPLILGVAAAAALDVLAWILALVATVRQRSRPR